MYIYLIMSVICENSIDALRSYSAKKKQRMHLILLFSRHIIWLYVNYQYGYGYCHLTAAHVPPCQLELRRAWLGCVW